VRIVDVCDATDLDSEHAFIIRLVAALRLAAQVGEKPEDRFRGVPIPAIALMLCPRIANRVLGQETRAQLRSLAQLAPRCPACSGLPLPCPTR
jgi:hypothetical protein